MAEPGLSEIINYRPDPDLAQGNQSVPIDNSKLIDNLNQNARFKAQQDWSKYNLFLENFKEFAKDSKEISETPVAPEDREHLNGLKKELFTKIYENPKDFFGPGNFAKKAELDKQLNELRSGTMESKMNRAYDEAHREYISRNPETNTPQNRGTVDGYLKKPLGKRRPYILNMNPILDLPTLAKGLNDASKSVTPTTQFTEGGQFVETGAQTSYDPLKFKELASSMYDFPTKDGQILREPLKQTFDSLPEEEKAKYQNQKDPVKSWYLDTVDKFRLKDSYTKENVKPNPFLLEQQRSKNRLDELGKKFNLEERLEGFKEGNREKLAQQKVKLKGKSEGQQYNWLKDTVNGLISEAITGPATYHLDRKNNTTTPMFKLNVGNDVLELFKRTEGGGETKTTLIPDELFVDKDGKTVIARVYQKDKNGNVVLDGNGNKITDDDRTKTFSKKGLMASLGKNWLGVTGSMKELESDDDDDAEGTTTDIESLRSKYDY